MSCNYLINVEGITKEFYEYKTPFHNVMGLLREKNTPVLNTFVAVSDVSFKINKGERVGIVGANGAGKSTILQMLAGTVIPTSGKIEINGKIAALLELGAGFNPEFTGIENIYLYASLLGIEQGNIESKIPNICDFADIGDFINKPVKTYSSGMFVRLAFSVAINVEPEILIVDEALSVGDYLFQSKCHRAFEEFQKKGGTVLFVSHDLTAVRNTCDRAILINKGKLILDSTPDVVVNSYQELMKTNEIEWMKSQDKLRSEYRFGVGGGSIEDVIISTSDQDDTCDVKASTAMVFKVFYNLLEDFSFPVITFTLRNTSGIEVWGFNTKNMGVIVNKKKGKGVLNIATPNYLATGSYTINVGLVDMPDGAPFIDHDHRWGMKLLSIYGDNNCIGFVNMMPDISFDEVVK